VKPSDAKLDQAILSASLPQWRKVALILGKSFRQLEGEGIQATFEDLAAHVESLVREGLLESQGDLSKWRHSEVRMISATPVIPRAALATPSPRPSRGEGKGEGRRKPRKRGQAHS
jgi:hypothetical protein